MTAPTWATRGSHEAGVTCRSHPARPAVDGADQCGPCVVERGRLAWQLVNDTRRQLGAATRDALHAREHAVRVTAAADRVLHVLGPQADRDDLADPAVWRPWLARLAGAAASLADALDERITR